LSNPTGTNPSKALGHPWKQGLLHKLLNNPSSLESEGVFVLPYALFQYFVEVSFDMPNGLELICGGYLLDCEYDEFGTMNSMMRDTTV